MNAALASRRNTGVLLGITSSIFFSASGTFAKALTDAGSARSRQYGCESPAPA